MGCQSCKDKNNNVEKLSVFKNDNLNKEPKGIIFKIFEYTIRTIIFAIMMVLSPLIMFFVWYLLFKTLILDNGNVSLMPFLISVSKKLNLGRPKIDYDNDDDYEDLDVDNLDDYELAEPVDEIRI